MLPEPKVTRQRNETSHLSVQSLHGHCGRLVSRLESGADRLGSRSYAHSAILIHPSVVEDHRYGGSRGTRKTITQRKIHCTRGLQRQLLIAAN